MQQFSDFIIPYLIPIQTFCAIAVIILILMQNRGAGLSSSFGGGNEVYLTRRGIEKWVVNFTVILISIMVIVRIVNLFIG